MSSTLKFVIRQDRPDKYGKCTVRLIYQISGDRKFIPYENKLHPLNWDAAQQRAVFIAFPKAKTELKNDFKDAPFDIDKIILTDREIKDVNADLSKMATDIRTIEQRFTALKKSYTIQDIADEYKAGQLSLEKKIDERNSLHHFIGRYISDHSEKLTKGTITIYETLQGNIKDYQSANKRVYTFEDVNYGFFQSFQNYLIKLGNPE